MARKTQEEYIREVSEVHSNKYSYERLDYKGSTRHSAFIFNTIKRGSH